MGDVRRELKAVGEAELRAWVDGLIRKRTVYGALEKEERFVFDRLESAQDLRLDYDVTILPPKKYFLPQKEVLSTFDRYTMQFEAVIETDPFVVFGVHPYDVEAIRQLDLIFRKDHADAHYLARREAATIVALDVETPSKDVFAGCMGHATCERMEGFDLLLTRIDDDGTYLLDARTDKGLALLADAAGATDATGEQIERRRAVWKRNGERLKQHKLELHPSDLPQLLAGSEDHPVWEEKAELCYSCGSCNLVCPTCYCFDVQDEMDWDPAKGRRVRTWDGCMLAGFAEVAGGHNFREQRSERYRHRYYRKGKYVHDMIGEIGCVGCGRCISACTVEIANPVEIFNRLLDK